MADNAQNLDWPENAGQSAYSNDAALAIINQKSAAQNQLLDNLGSVFTQNPNLSQYTDPSSGIVYTKLVGNNNEFKGYEGTDPRSKRVVRYDENRNQTASLDPTTGFGELIKPIIPLALGMLAPGLGAGIGSALGAGATWAPVVGGAALGGGAAALTGGDVLKGAVLGGLGGAGNIGIGDTGVTVGQVTTGANILKNAADGNILGAVTGAANLGGLGNTEIAGTGVTLNDLAKDYKLAQAFISGRPEAVVSALTSVAKTAMKNEDYNSVLNSYTTPIGSPSNTADISNAVNNQTPVDDGTTAGVDQQIAAQTTYPTNDVAYDQLVAALSNPTNVSNNPSVQVASADNNAALANLADANMAAKIDRGEVIDLGTISNKPPDETLPTGLNFPGDQSTPTQEQQQQSVNDFLAALDETQTEANPNTDQFTFNAEPAAAGNDADFYRMIGINPETLTSADNIGSTQDQLDSVDRIINQAYKADQANQPVNEWDNASSGDDLFTTEEPVTDEGEMVITAPKDELPNEVPDYSTFDEDILRQIEDPTVNEPPPEPKTPASSAPKTPAAKTPAKTPAAKTPAVNTDALKALLGSLLANQQQYMPSVGDVAHIKSNESLFGAIPGTEAPASSAHETQHDPIAELLAQGNEDYASGGHVNDFSVDALLHILRS